MKICFPYSELRCCLLLLLLLPLAPIRSQVLDTVAHPVLTRLGDWLPDSVELTGSTQGFAIHQGKAYMLRHGGQCVVLDLKKMRYLNAFYLEGNSSHCNNASFLPASVVDEIPRLLVSECFDTKCGYVMRVSSEGATVEQCVYFDSDRFLVAQDWCVDAENQRLYAYGGKRGDRVYLLAFPLPDADLHEVRYSESDVLAIVPIDCVSVAQGSKIYHGYAFLLDGLPPGSLWLHVISLATGQEVQRIDLNGIGLEPEGLDVWDGWLYVTFHTPDPRNNSIYRFRLL